MAYTNIDAATPLGSDKGKVLDNQIRALKAAVKGNLAENSNYATGDIQPDVPALRTAVWTTATRPTGTSLVDRVSGYNTDLGAEEYYDLATTTWKTKGVAPSHVHAANTVSNTPAGNIAATNVQNAINELDTEKAGKSLNNTFSGTNNFTGAMTVLAAGASGNPVRLGQLLGNIGTTGYIKFPILDGSTLRTFELKWGTGGINTDVTFAAPFANSCLYVGLTPSDYTDYYQVTSTSKTGFVNEGNVSSPFLWFAFGC